MDTIIDEATSLLLDWRIWGTVLGFTIWGTALGLANYYAGQKGLPAIQKRFPSLGPEKFEQVDVWYNRWGARMLLISGVPVLNTMVCLGAGVHGVRKGSFIFWSAVGLLLRNWVLLLFLYIVARRIF